MDLHFLWMDEWMDSDGPSKSVEHHRGFHNTVQTAPASCQKENLCFLRASTRHRVRQGETREEHKATPARRVWARAARLPIGVAESVKAASCCQPPNLLCLEKHATHLGHHGHALQATHRRPREEGVRQARKMIGSELAMLDASKNELIKTATNS